MKLTKILTAGVLSVSMLFSSSCTDFIDIIPENSVPAEGVDFSKTENMYQPVISVYSSMRTNILHWIQAGLLLTRDGDVWSGRIDDQAGLLGFCGHEGVFNYDNGFWGVNEAWRNYYVLIQTANSALESLEGYAQYIDKNSETFKTYESYCAEVKTLRALAYYDLAVHFGPVVIYRSNNQSDFRRSSVDLVYKYILEDLDYAMKKLPRVRPNQMAHPGAVSAFTAEMIAARVNLLMGNWPEVERLTQDIIDHGNFQLYPDFYQLFKIPGKLCDESLFEVQVTDFGTGSGELIDADNWFTFQGPANDGNISGWGFVGYRPEFVAWAEGRGETVRTTTSFLKAGSTTPDGDKIRPLKNPTQTNCWNGKAYLPTNQLTPGRTKYGTNNNIRFMRYAEVLLMNSESKIRNGKDGDFGYNEVRKRAKMSTKSGVTVKDVIDERRMELCCEIGWAHCIDLYRTYGTAEQQDIPSEWEGKWSAEYRYLPVPFTQIEELPDLLLDPMTE